MNSVKNNKKIIVFAILESNNAYTEINFFEQFINSIKNEYKKIFFIYPFSIDGNIKKSENFVNEFFNKLKSNVKFNTNRNFDSFDQIYIYCIWDTSKQKNNYKPNYNLIKKYEKNNEKIKYDCLIFENGIEKGLFSYFFRSKLLSTNKLKEKLGYKKWKDIKSRTNKGLFWNIMKKAEIDTNSNILLNIKKRLLKNGEDNFLKMLIFIEKLNN